MPANPSHSWPVSRFSPILTATLHRVSNRGLQPAPDCYVRQHFEGNGDFILRYIYIDPRDSICGVVANVNLVTGRFLPVQRRTLPDDEVSTNQRFQLKPNKEGNDDDSKRNIPDDQGQGRKVR